MWEERAMARWHPEHAAREAAVLHPVHFLQKAVLDRDAVNRVMVAAAIIAAIVLPIFWEEAAGTPRKAPARASLLSWPSSKRRVRSVTNRAARTISTRGSSGWRNRPGLATWNETATPRTGARWAPDFRLLDLEGEPHRLSDIDGPIVLNFWASWCEPCVEEMPDFEIINQELAGRVTFIGVNDGESLETARKFAYNVTKVQYLVLLDPTKS